MNIAATPTSDKPQPTPEQGRFLTAVRNAMSADSDTVIRMRLSGGPGTGKSFTVAQAANAAADEGWSVLLMGPTHQATGVLAEAVPMAFPFDPDSGNGLTAGEIQYGTAHKMATWVQRSRSRGAAAGETDPVPRDSWLGRAFKRNWDAPPDGVLVFADETSMYHGQMANAVVAVCETIHRLCGKVIFVAVGDPDQLTPVRGPTYVYTEREGPETPSPLVSDRSFDDYNLVQNVRAKSAVLRNVVTHFLTSKVVIPPPQDQTIYVWTDADERFFEHWADRIRTGGTESAIMLGYRRAAVAQANDRMCQILHGAPAYQLSADRIMRVQQTYTPGGRTLAASSDLVRVLDVREVEHEIAEKLLPPAKGHKVAHDPAVISIFRDVLEIDIKQNGPFTVADVGVLGTRSGILRGVPVVVASEHGAMTPTMQRWGMLEGSLFHAAFRRNHADATVRRGMGAIAYFVADDAKLRLEAPYAMTSHRAQGSTYRNVAVLADNPMGGRIVDHRVESARDSSTYVMLSRASESLTIAWTPRMTNGWF